MTGIAQELSVHLFLQNGKVVGTNQVFYFILKRLAFIGGVAIILVIFAVFGHIGVRGFKVFRGGGMRLAWSVSSRRRDLGTFSGAYMENRGLSALVDTGV